MAKEEIACFEQFLQIYHDAFKSRLLQMRQKASVCGKGLKTVMASTYFLRVICFDLFLPNYECDFYTENIMGKGKWPFFSNLSFSTNILFSYYIDTF